MNRSYAIIKRDSKYKVCQLCDLIPDDEPYSVLINALTLIQALAVKDLLESEVKAEIQIERKYQQAINRGRAPLG